jgi:ligand-binding sensor domain-containing protein
MFIGNKFIGILLCLLLTCACMQPSGKTVSLPLSAIQCLSAVEEIRDIAFEGEHIVWSATPGGLLKLDRRRGQWTVFTAASGLPSNNVTALLYSSSGILWIGTDRGLCSLSGGAFAAAGTEDTLPSPVITALAEGGDGAVYAGTMRGIARSEDGTKWEPVSDTHEFARRRVRDIARDRDGSLWFVKENALSHFRTDGTWEIFHKDLLLTNAQAGFLSVNLLSMAADRAGVKWIGTTAGLSSYDGSRWRNYYNRERIERHSGLKNNWIETVAAGPENSIWVAHGDAGSNNKLSGAGVMSQPGSWSYLSTAEGLPSNSVYKLKTAPDNKLWLGTAKGLARIAGGRVQAFIPPRILPDNHVLSLLSDADRVFALLPRDVIECAPGSLQSVAQTAWSVRGGLCADHRIYAAGVDRGLYILGDGAQSTEDSFFTNKTILHLAKGKDEKIFAVCRENVFQGTPGSWSEFPLPARSKDVQVLKTFSAPGGDIWITGERAVRAHDRQALCFIYRSGTLMEVSVPSLCEQYAGVNHIIFNRDGAPFLVSPAGIYKYQSGWQELRTPMPKGSIYAATWDAANRLLAGGRDCGLFLYERNVWRELLFNGSSVPGWITSLQVRGTDELWVGTAEQGIFRIALPGNL